MDILDEPKSEDEFDFYDGYTGEQVQVFGTFNWKDFL